MPQPVSLTQKWTYGGATSRAKRDLAAFGEFARVAEQVEQNLAQAHGIGADQRQALGQVEPPFNVR